MCVAINQSFVMSPFAFDASALARILYVWVEGLVGVLAYKVGERVVSLTQHVYV